MIPPGTAVRDAHACYEVVVPVTVPDKPRLTPCCLLLPLPPHCHTHQREHERNSTPWNRWRIRCKTIKTKIDEYNARKSHWEEVEGGVDGGWPLADGW
jgi:hypothetical protein